MLSTVLLIKNNNKKKWVAILNKLIKPTILSISLVIVKPGAAVVPALVTIALGIYFYYLLVKI